MGRKRATFRNGIGEADRQYAQALRDICDHRGETQQELGRLLGWSVSTVSRFEAATERPDRATHQRYCALAPTEELRRRTAAAYEALPPDGSAQHAAVVHRSPEEWHGRALDGPGVYRLLEATYPAYPLARLFGDEAKPLPVWAELAPAKQWTDVEAPLGQLDLSQPPPSVRTWRYWEPLDPRGEAEFKHHLDDWDRQLREIRAGRRAHLDTWNQLTYDLHAMTRDEQGRVQLHCKLGTYYHSLSTSECLDPELLEAYAAWPDSQPEQVWPRLERRAWLHERVADPVADGRYRSAAVGVSTLTIVRVRTRTFDGYKLFLSPRSVTVATQRRRYHVVPSGMFQPFIPGDASDLLQGQFSVGATVMREFVEELYGVEELETGDGRVDPEAIYRRREARLLSDLLGAGDAALLYSGVAVNLLALRPEICTVLIIDDPGWYQRECGELRICDEYLQQCEQAELLPDQRWVQLINLERHDLELDPKWREHLRARTVVAPGVAAIDLGLRVARFGRHLNPSRTCGIVGWLVGRGLMEAPRRLAAAPQAVAGDVNAATLPAVPTGCRLTAGERQGAAMSDDRPRAPTYGPPITIPSAYLLGLVAHNAWCEAHRDDPAVDWMELSEAERAMWQRIATKVAEQIRDATERSHALGNYLPPPRCPAQRRDLYTFYICCRWDPHPAEHGTDDEGHRWVPVEP